MNKTDRQEEDDTCPTLHDLQVLQEQEKLDLLRKFGTLIDVLIAFFEEIHPSPPPLAQEDVDDDYYCK